MAAASSSSSNSLLSVIYAILLLASQFFYVSEADHISAPVVKGLSWNFHHSSCPKVETIVRKHLRKVFKEDVGLAAGLLRLHFHDCFVQGCDGSVLLDGSASWLSEKEAPPNLSWRAGAIKVIEHLRELVHKECGRVVSCADITALSARDAVYLSQGPYYDVPLGRRDGLNFATRNATLANLPPPSSNASALLTFLATKKLDAIDVVALSGGHTIGHTNKFDNKYYIGLVNRQGLFTSDQDLYMDSRTRGIVTSFADDQTLFFDQLVLSMIKIGQLSVLTGRKGEVRANCSVRNSDNHSYLTYMVEDDEESKLELR